MLGVCLGGDSRKYVEGAEKARWGGRKASEGCVNELVFDESAGSSRTGDLMKNTLQIVPQRMGRLRIYPLNPVP